MRSKIAEELRQEQMAEERILTPDERIQLAREMREFGIRLYMAGRRMDRSAAIRAIRRERQDGRRYSRCMIESLA